MNDGTRFYYDRTLFCPSRIPLHKPLMAMGHIYLFQCTSHKSALVFSHRTSLENINIKFCPSLNWTLFCYGRTHFLLLHLAKGVQAGHLTSALHRHTTQQHRLHCTIVWWDGTCFSLFCNDSFSAMVTDRTSFSLKLSHRMNGW